MRRRAIVRTALVVGILLVVVRAGWLAAGAGVGQAITNGPIVLLGRTGESIAGAARSFLRVGSLAAHVRELEEQLARREAEQTRRAALLRENEELREQLGLLPRARFHLVVADVVGPTSDGVTGAFRINRGVEDGIQPGAPVIAADGVVVGRIAKAHARSALVDPLTGGRMRLTARSVTTGAEGIVRGLRGLDVIVEGVPRTQELRVGDRLVTSGTDGVFPPHLLVGTIKSVRADANAVFQEGSIQLPLDLVRLRVVAVLRE